MITLKLSSLLPEQHHIIMVQYSALVYLKKQTIHSAYKEALYKNLMDLYCLI